MQRVPETESQGRVHTSTVTVAVLPMQDEIEEKEIDKNESYITQLISNKKIADVIIEDFDIEDDLAHKLTAMDNKIVISMIKEISRAS